jgi:hypothetical protein
MKLSKVRTIPIPMIKGSGVETEKNNPRVRKTKASVTDRNRSYEEVR